MPTFVRATFFRLHPMGEDAATLLRPETQWTEPQDAPAEGGRRRGIRVFEELDALYRHAVRHDEEDLDEGHCVVELEAVRSPDEDPDATEGAILAYATRIVGVRPVEEERIEAARRIVAGQP